MPARVGPIMFCRQGLLLLAMWCAGAAHAAAAADDWYTGILDPQSSPVDLSFLNAPERPAGKHGFLKAVGEQLVFEDGTVARFWGTNINAYALFGTPPANVRRQARRLSQLGFNLVRIHHHDSSWVSPNIFGAGPLRDTRHLDAAMLERLDWWIKCLKEEGIYVWLDLHVGRRLRSGDGIEAFDEIRKGKPDVDLRGYSYVNPDIQRAMQDFNTAYVGHVSRHTGLRLADEPAIAAFLLTNENDLTSHFGNALLPDKGVPWHHEAFMREAGAFARAWGLAQAAVARTWEHGPSRLFLNDLEQRLDARLVAGLRAQGVKAPIVTTSSWGMNPVSSLPALASGDIVDVHAYGGAGELQKDPLAADSLVHWLSAARVAGKPLSVTEWGVETRGRPAADRHAMPLFIAAWARRQGWNAVMHFAYAQEALGVRSTPSVYHAYNDPAMIAALPAAALLFRRGDVPEAAEHLVFSVDQQLFFGKEISARNSVALRTAAEAGRLSIALPKTPALPWLIPGSIPAGATSFADPRQSMLPAAVGGWAAGGLRRDWKQGSLLVDTPRTQAAMGRIGGLELVLGDVTVRATTASATVAVQSLDGAPIHASRQLLVSLGAGATERAGGSTPYAAEPVAGQLSIRAPPGLRLQPLDRGGNKGRPLPVRYADGRYVIELTPALGSYWLTLS